MKFTFKTTMRACFMSYIAHAAVNNFVPLLFVTFQQDYHIPLDKITLLVTVNFGVQLIVDLLAAKFVDRIGYRPSAVAAQLLAAAGLALLTVLPGLMDPFMGILLSVIVYALAMSLLHSFYCWGHVGVVLISTLFFHLAGVGNWRVLALIWAVLPILNSAVFCFTPLAPLLPEEEKGMGMRELLSNKAFWLLFVMMLCAGASEQSVSQWASAFAERGLGVSKTLGDLMGPMAFAALMGLSRALYGKFGQRARLDRVMRLSAALCAVSYLLVALPSSPAVNLLGCGLCGLSVGIMWPGTLSKASAALPAGGTAMFALLALGGDLGCSGGPTLVGLVGGAAGGDMKPGLLLSGGFALIMLICLFTKTPKHKGTNPPET
nr:MFS transporter [Acutalibacter muris]